MDAPMDAPMTLTLSDLVNPWTKSKQRIFLNYAMRPMREVCFRVTGGRLELLLIKERDGETLTVERPGMEGWVGLGGLENTYNSWLAQQPRRGM